MPTPSRRQQATPAIAVAAPIELRPRGDFVEWLAASGGTLAVTTYNSGKLALLSAPAGELEASCWSFARPMGLAVDGTHLALATRDHFWEFEIAAPSSRSAAETRLLVPCIVRWTGRLDAHDVAFDRRGALFANTGFNCVSRPSERLQFKRVWQRAFIRESSTTTKVTKGDCCHLNGIGVHAGRLAMATAFCERSEPAAWRATDRFQSGVLIDVLRDEVVVRGLCLPHSPRWHAGRWWLCDSGRGSLCQVEADSDGCKSVIELPGFTRGLTFVGDRAVAGLSRIRQRHILDAPPVRDRWRRLRSGLSLVDWRRGVETGALEFVRGGREVYDVEFFPGEPRLEFGG